MRILVLVVDGNTICIEGIASLIRAQADMELVGLAHTAEAAISLYSQARPDLTLVDLDLPMAAGIERIRSLRVLDPSALIVGLAVYELDTSGAAALSAGAAAIVAKDQAAEMLPRLIRTLVHG